VLHKTDVIVLALSGPDGGQKSGIIVDFNTLSYHFRSPGDMSDDELDEVVDFLMDRIETQEKTELFHLENFHETLEAYVLSRW
jgi:ATP-dependent DNA helicase Q4